MKKIALFLLILSLCACNDKPQKPTKQAPKPEATEAAPAQQQKAPAKPAPTALPVPQQVKPDAPNSPLPIKAVTDCPKQARLYSAAARRLAGPAAMKAHKIDSPDALPEGALNLTAASIAGLLCAAEKLQGEETVRPIAECLAKKKSSDPDLLGCPGGRALFFNPFPEKICDQPPVQIGPNKTADPCTAARILIKSLYAAKSLNRYQAQ